MKTILFNQAVALKCNANLFYQDFLSGFLLVSEPVHGHNTSPLNSLEKMKDTALSRTQRNAFLKNKKSIYEK